MPVPMVPAPTMPMLSTAICLPPCGKECTRGERNEVSKFQGVHLREVTADSTGKDQRCWDPSASRQDDIQEQEQKQKPHFCQRTAEVGHRFCFSTFLKL